MVFNFTPVPRDDYRIGVPGARLLRRAAEQRRAIFGGSNRGNGGGVHSEPVAAHGFDHSLRLMVPPLACLFLKKRS